MDGRDCHSFMLYLDVNHLNGKCILCYFVASWAHKLCVKQYILDNFEEFIRLVVYVSDDMQWIGFLHGIISFTILIL